MFIEVMVVVAVTAVLLGLTVPLLVSLFQWDSRFRGRGLEREQMLRLAESLRADIRQAHDASLADGSLVLTMNDESQTRYETVPEGCRRVHRGPDAARPQIELFAIGETRGFTLTSRKAGVRPLIVVTLARFAHEADQERPRPPVVVQAALAADRAPKSDELVGVNSR